MSAFLSRPQEALQSCVLVTVIDRLRKFYLHSSRESRDDGAGRPSQLGQQESEALLATYSSQLLGRFKIALKSLLESTVRAVLFQYEEAGRERVSVFTQDLSMRRYPDPSRNSWTEAPKAQAQRLQAVAAVSRMLHQLVQLQSNNPSKGVWEELAKTDSFIGLLLQAYLLCVSSKLEVEANDGPSVLECVRVLVHQVDASSLVKPVIAVLRWCGRDQAGLLPHILDLMRSISAREGGEVFMELLVERHALEVAVEGFLGSCASQLPSEPSLLQLPYIWHLYRVNGNDDLRNLSEFGK